MEALATGQEIMSFFLKDYELYIEGIGFISFLSFVASLLIFPWIIGRLKEDYFLQLHTHKKREDEHPFTFLFLRLLRYLLGAILLIAGILMLFLPGQGLLTIILGLSLLDFPGKQKVIDWLLRKEFLQRTLNWIREKEHKKPFLFKQD
jgi:hypothetical protein